MTRRLDGLRDAVLGLGRAGTESVDSVRRAFTAGIAPLQVASSGSAADFISRFGDGSELVRSTARLGLKTSPVGSVIGPPRPEIDFVEVETDPTYGVLDSFYTRVMISLPLADVGGISLIRVLRCSNGPIAGVSRPAFSAFIDGGSPTNRRKGSDTLAGSAFRAAELGVGNKLTGFIADDPHSAQRVAFSSGTLRVPPPVPNTNRRGTSTGLLSISNVDRSVLEDVTFFLNRRTLEPTRSPDLPLTVAARQGINVLRGASVGSSTSFVEGRNAAGFRELGRLPVSSRSYRTVGDFAEISFFDPTVVHGNSYTYYVVCQAPDGTESQRSRLVTANVIRRRPPSTPTVLYSIIAGRPRFSITCGGQFIDHVEVFRHGGNRPELVRLLGSDRAAMVDVPPAGTDLDFYHVGDLGVSADRSTTFVDMGVLGGQAVDYRFYTVDSFGSKCQTPFSCSLRIPSPGQPIPLSVPSITVEQGVGGRIVNVSVSCDDPRVTSFVVARREIGNGSGYSDPSCPAYFDLGPKDATRSRSRQGPHLVAGQKSWNGVLRVVSGGANFVDTAVGFDRTYRYSVYGVDLRGNRSFQVPSGPVKVSVKPVAERPVGVTARLIGGSVPTGVEISWDAGTQDISPPDLIGDQQLLADTVIRSVFQVERRQVGHAVWDSMPAVTGSSFIDPVSDRPAPPFRPAFVEMTRQYEYRVIAMQSGGFISNYTDPVRVAVLPELLPPSTIWVRSTDTAARPIHVVVSWEYSGEFVDGWQIERAVTNKVYGSKIMTTDSREARELQYLSCAEIRRESSRAMGLASVDMTGDARIFVGNRFFIDQDVTMANSYFYRIRAVDRQSESGWSYAGIILRDSPHDRKLMSALSDDERVALSADPRPIAKWRNG